MSQIQERNALQATLNYDSLVEKQRREMSSSTISDITTSTTNIHSSEIDTAKKNQEDGQEKIMNIVNVAPSLPLSSSSLVGDEKEWISNWGFRRVPSTKKPLGFNSEFPLPLPSTIAKTNNEGGVFYFERIKLNDDNNNIIADTVDLTSVTPTRVSSSSSDIIGNSDVDAEQNLDNDNFEEQDLGFCCFDMTNDDLFGDLEAAADSNDDSELSFEDFMDMDVVDGDDIDIDNHNTYDDDEHAHDYVHQYSTGLHDVDEFLNKSTSTATANNIPVDDDDDIHMMNQDDDAESNSNKNMHIYSSPIPSKASISSSLLHGSLQDYRNSPTCVAHPMACNVSSSTSPLLTNSFSMSSASTRPAFHEMRKMMTKFIHVPPQNRVKERGQTWVKGKELPPIEQLYSYPQDNVPFWPRSRLYIFGNYKLLLKAEYLFFYIPTIIILGLCIPAFTTIYAAEEVVASTMTVKVTGRQWYWVYEVESPTDDGDEDDE